MIKKRKKKKTKKKVDKTDKEKDDKDIQRKEKEKEKEKGKEKEKEKSKDLTKEKENNKEKQEIKEEEEEEEIKPKHEDIYKRESFSGFDSAFRQARGFLESNMRGEILHKEPFVKSEHPKITAIIPVYNAQDTITRAVRSIQNQNMLY